MRRLQQRSHSPRSPNRRIILVSRPHPMHSRIGAISFGG